MVNLGMWSELDEGDAKESSAAIKRALKAAGCNKFHHWKGQHTSNAAKLLDGLQVGDRITVVALSNLNIKPSELSELLQTVHNAGIEIVSLEGLTLPTGKPGDQIFQWLKAMDTLNSLSRSRAVRTGIAKSPRQRKLSDSLRPQFLKDAKSMSQGKLADKYGVSIMTARKYLAEWEK